MCARADRASFFFFCIGGPFPVCVVRGHGSGSDGMDVAGGP